MIQPSSHDIGVEPKILILITVADFVMSHVFTPNDHAIVINVRLT